MLGTALLARMSGTMKSIMDQAPSGRSSDTKTLLRSLYEHVVHFAWLAADPSAERVEEWRKGDLVARLKADKDNRDHGVPLLRVEERERMQREVGELRGDPLKLIDLAVAANKAWAGKFPGLESDNSPYSFSGAYATLYRYTSSTSHPSWLGTYPVVTDLSDTRRRVHLEEDGEPGSLDPVGLATSLLGFALFIAGDALGWPRCQHVLDAFHQ